MILSQTSNWVFTNLDPSPEGTFILFLDPVYKQIDRVVYMQIKMTPYWPDYASLIMYIQAW